MPLWYAVPQIESSLESWEVQSLPLSLLCILIFSFVADGNISLVDALLQFHQYMIRTRRCSVSEYCCLVSDFILKNIQERVSRSVRLSWRRLSQPVSHTNCQLQHKLRITYQGAIIFFQGENIVQKPIHNLLVVTTQKVRRKS